MRRTAPSMARTMTPALASRMPAVQRRRARSSTSTPLSWRRCGRTGTSQAYRQSYSAGYSNLLDTLGDGRSCFRTSTWRTALALVRGDVPVLVSRLGVAAMRTHYDVEQDGHRLGSRQTRRRTAWTMVIRASLPAPEARWRVVPCDGSLCRVAKL